MPSSKDYVRDYKQEYKTSVARGEQDAGSDGPAAKRKRARREMLKMGMVKKGQDVDHKKPLSKGGSNDRSNLKAASPSKNRSYSRNSDGSIKGGSK